MEQMIGKQSIQFERAVHILSAASIVGKKEGDGPLGKYFDRVGEEDGLFGCKSWEEAESFLQKEAVSMAIQKAGIEKWQLRMIYAGDLLAQTIASSFGIMGFHTPVLVCTEHARLWERDFLWPPWQWQGDMQNMWQP